MRGHDAIARALVEQGVDTAFGVMGDGNLFIGEALMRVHGVHYTAATHEASAVLMAQGFSKVTGRLGVATVTHGPGLTNTITALIEGARARTPMLLVAGDTPTPAEHHLQNIGQREFVSATWLGLSPHPLSGVDWGRRRRGRAPSPCRAATHRAQHPARIRVHGSRIPACFQI